MYSSILLFHLGGAAVTGLVLSGAGLALWKNNALSYHWYAIILGALAAFEILSGVALSVVSPEVTALSLCKNVALYLTVVFAMEGLLFIRIKTTFPTRLAFSPVLFSLVLMASAISYGF